METGHTTKILRNPYTSGSITAERYAVMDHTSSLLVIWVEVWADMINLFLCQRPGLWPMVEAISSLPPCHLSPLTSLSSLRQFLCLCRFVFFSFFFFWGNGWYDFIFQADNASVPVKVRDDYAVQVFYLLPSGFSQPKASIYLVLGSPLAYSSPRNFVLNQILAQLVINQLSDYVYSASLAGLTISIQSDRKGIIVRIRSYSFSFRPSLHWYLLPMQVSIDGFNDHIVDVIDELSKIKQNLVFNAGSFEAARTSVCHFFVHDTI